jgi:hypothetical protein
MSAIKTPAMLRLPIISDGTTRAVAGLVLSGALVATTGCHSSAPDPAPTTQAKLPDLPQVSGSVADVIVEAAQTSHASPGRNGRAWYVTAVKDPDRGIYTAAVERQSLTRLSVSGTSDGAQRATLALLLTNGHPSDLVLSVEGARFVCAGRDRDNACLLRVRIDNATPRSVRFAIPRRWPPTRLHLAGGDDARRLLAGIARAKSLRIQPTLAVEGSMELEFPLAGLAPAIARVVRHSVAATPKPPPASTGA